MRPEDWLRERGIEIAPTAPRSGDRAGQATEMLPVVPPQALTELATQRIPAVADIADIADLPTGQLNDNAESGAPAVAADDLTETAPLPATDITTTPTRRLPR